MQVRLSHVNGLPSARLSGRFSGEDVITWLAGATQEDTAPAAVLCDLTKADFAVPSSEVISAAQSCAVKMVMPPRLAFVVAGGLGYGMMRMFVSFLRTAAADQACVFRNEDEAIQWLGELSDPRRRPRRDRRQEGASHAAA